MVSIIAPWKLSKMLVMIKPWSLKHADNIFSKLDNRGTMLKYGKIEEITFDLISRHYADHKGKDYFDAMINDFIGLSAIVAVYEGNLNEFDTLKKILRVDYPCYNSQGSIQKKNALHISDSDEESFREIEICSPYLKGVVRKYFFS